MKILYKQPDAPRNEGEDPLFSLGVRQLFLKQLSLAWDDGRITKKRHHHQSYEVHFLMQGQQRYGVDGREFLLRPGQLFLIPPTVPHRVLESTPETQRFSLCFSVEPGSVLQARLQTAAECLQAECPEQIPRLLKELSKELGEKQPLFQWVAGGYLTALVLAVLRLVGVKDDEPVIESADEDYRLTLATQFINDNAELAPSVPEVAAYCHLSCRQLTRIFLQIQQCTPAAYIRQVRFRRAEAMLVQTNLPLRQISERMHFSSEYYFNKFFHHHAGMSPGEFRKMSQAAG